MLLYIHVILWNNESGNANTTDHSLPAKFGRQVVEQRTDFERAADEQAKLTQTPNSTTDSDSRQIAIFHHSALQRRKNDNTLHLQKIVYGKMSNYRLKIFFQNAT